LTEDLLASQEGLCSMELALEVCFKLVRLSGLNVSARRKNVRHILVLKMTGIFLYEAPLQPVSGSAVEFTLL
jgi:hypothetical protein